MQTDSGWSGRGSERGLRSVELVLGHVVPLVDRLDHQVTDETDDQKAGQDIHRHIVGLCVGQ